MDVKPGFSYHIKDQYFDMAKERHIDQYLMSNKENGNFRPSFLCLEDKANPELLWFVPISCQIEKYKAEVEKKIARYGKCNTIVIGDFSGKENAFLIQNIFPTTSQYIDHIHTVSGVPVTLQTRLQAEIEDNVKNVLRMHSRGMNLVFTKIDALKQMVMSDLQKSKTAELKTSVLTKLESLKSNDKPPIKKAKDIER
ncbi:hypothetical protein V6615_16355 (plasmid) [Oscillospiraceae bacterium PP1C4]